jgi:hypothetical protein
MVKLTDEEIVRVCAESISMGQAAKTLGVSIRWLREKATPLGCYQPNQGGKGVSKFPDGHTSRIKFDMDEWNRDVAIKVTRPCIKRWILRLELIPYECANGCDIMWRGEKLSLDLDHINGINDDHRKSNLRFLCPNCHSQTHTFRNKCRD